LICCFCVCFRLLLFLDLHYLFCLYWIFLTAQNICSCWCVFVMPRGLQFPRVVYLCLSTLLSLFFLYIVGFVFCCCRVVVVYFSLWKFSHFWGIFRLFLKKKDMFCLCSVMPRDFKLHVGRLNRLEHVLFVFCYAT